MPPFWLTFCARDYVPTISFSLTHGLRPFLVVKMLASQAKGEGYTEPFTGAALLGFCYGNAIGKREPCRFAASGAPTSKL
jgi:hypothetical protein